MKSTILHLSILEKSIEEIFNISVSQEIFFTMQDHIVIT